MSNCCNENSKRTSIQIQNIGSSAKTFRLFSNLEAVDDNTEVVASDIEVVATIGTGTNPYYGTLDPVNNRIYVSNQGGGTVSVIDCDTNAVIATITVGTTPRNPCYDPVNQRMYVSNIGSDNVSVISTDIDDPSYNTVITTIAVGDAPRPGEYDPVNQRVYVPNGGGGTGNTVSVISTVSNTVIATVTVENDPTTPIYDSIHQRMYVPCLNGSNQFSIIDTATNTATSLNTGVVPGTGFFDAGTGKVFIGETVLTSSNIVTVIDTADNSVTLVSVPGQVLDCANTNKSYMYASGFSAGEVYAINKTTNAIEATITTGFGSRGGVQDTVNDLFFVPNQSANSVSVIDMDSQEVIKTLTVGSAPILLPVFDETNNQIFVSNISSNTVSVIGTTDARITPVTITVNGGTNTLSELNVDALTDPMCICELKLTVNDKTTFGNPLQKLLRNSTGQYERHLTNLYARYDADFSQNTLIIDGKDLKSCILDGFNYLQWIVPAGEDIHIDVKYCQYSRSAQVEGDEEQPVFKKKRKKYIHASRKEINI